MKRVITLLALSLSFVYVTPASGAIKQGSSCSKINSKATVAGVKYTCVKSGKKLIWNKGVKPAKPQQSQQVDSKPAGAENSESTSKPDTTPDPIVSDSSIYINSVQCKLAYTSPQLDQYIGFPRSERYAPSIGERKTIVLFVEFADLSADKKAIATWKNAQIPVAKKALSRMSYGKYNLSVDVNEKIYQLPGSYKAFTRSEFVNIPGSTPALGLEYGKFVAEAVKIADLDVDFSKYDFVNVVTPTFSPKAEGGATGGVGFNVDGKTSFLATVGPIDEYVDDSLKDNWLLHETGHILGLTHIYNFYSGTLGAWDPMGNVFGFDELHGWQRWYLSWIEDNQVLCMDQTAPKETTHFISPLTTATKETKSVMLKLSPTTALAIEVMRSTPENPYPKEHDGVIVYKVDTSLTGGQGSISIVSNPGERQPTKGGRAGIVGTLSVGQTLFYESYSIRVLKSSARGDHVFIVKN
jgi:M6 family metalloprotease-like protein